MDFSTVEEHQLMVDEARYGRPDFTRPLRRGVSSCGDRVRKRKRIYGEDYYELADFNVLPKFKMLKLDHEQCESLTPNGTGGGSSTTTISGGDVLLSRSTDVENECAARGGEETGTRSRKRYAEPTPTARHWSRFVLDRSQITTVCPECVSTGCLCDGRRF